MSEINGPKFSVNQINFSSTPKQNPEVQPEVVEAHAPKLQVFTDPKAEALGRTLLFKGADDVNHDLKALLENPQIAENSDEMFETALKAAQDAGVENPYEQAASFATGTM